MNGSRAADILPWVIAACLAGTTSFIFFPGFMSADSFYQWRQVIGEVPLTNGHPVLLVYLWRLLAWFWPDPGVLLLFNQAFYWSALVLLSIALFRTLLSRLILLGVVGFWPPLFIHSVHLWKDQVMIAGLTLAIASLMLAIRNRGQTVWLILALLGLFVAVAARHNSITTAAPLFLLLGVCVSNRFLPGAENFRWSLRAPNFKMLYSTAIGAALAMLVYFSVSRINDTGQHVSVLSMIQIWDISAVSIQEKRNLIPSYVEVVDDTEPTLDLLRNTYRPTDLLNTGRVLSFFPHREFEDELTQYWLEVIRTYPDEYLHHRTAMFEVMMGWNRSAAYYPFTPGIDPNEMGIEFTNLSERDLGYVLYAFETAAKTPVYFAWIYQVILIALFLVCSARLVTIRGLSSRSFFVLAISASAIATWLPLYFLAPAPDFRYILWTIMATLLSVTLFSFKDEHFEEALSPP